MVDTETPADKGTEYRYNRLTWAEMNGAIARQPVVILPTGSTEQHGRHLPIDVDLLLCESVCLDAGRVMGSEGKEFIEVDRNLGQ